MIKETFSSSAKKEKNKIGVGAFMRQKHSKKTKKTKQQRRKIHF